MATPSLPVSPGATNGTGSSLAVAIPSGVSAGDLLVIFAQTRGRTGVGSTQGTTVSTPAGWTSLASNENSSGNPSWRLLYKQAAGTEGGTTVTVTFGLTGDCGAVAAVVRGWDTSKAPQAAKTTPGSGGNTPDPPSLTPSFGTLPALWLALESSCNATVSAYPSGYGLGQTSGTGVGMAAKQQTVSSDDPGTFTVSSASFDWDAVTMAVPGTAAASAAFLPFFM